MTFPKLSIPESLKLLCLFIWGVILVVSATCLDYIIHDTLYKYGLVFSMEWAVPYWTVFGLLFVSIAFMVSLAYYLMRPEDLRNKLTAFLIWFSIIFQSFSGNEDALWFFISYLNGKSFIPLDQLWTWSPFYYVFGIHWTTLSQIFYTVIMNIIFVAIWVAYVIYLRKQENQIEKFFTGVGK